MRYYSTQRPIVPGSAPTYGLQEVHNFDLRTYCPEIDRYAWGWAEYDRILSDDETKGYELIPE